MASVVNIAGKLLMGYQSLPSSCRALLMVAFVALMRTTWLCRNTSFNLVTVVVVMVVVTPAP